MPLAATPHYPQRRADLRHGELRQCRIRLRDAGRPRRRASAHHQAVLGRKLGRRSTRSATRSTQRSRPSDVRLTMGGEPTFVSIDDFESAEWNTAAVGPTKREKADALIRRLRERFAPGGFLHYGQGKWYPGESLPRWTFSLYWRARRRAGLERPDADRRERAERPTSDRTMPSKLLTAIAGELGIEPRPWSARPMRTRPNGCSRKASCPTMSIRPIPSWRTRKSAAAWRSVFERGLTKPTGYVLPVQRWNSQAPRTALASAKNGRRGAASCSWCRAIRRSATACRSARCPMCRRRSIPYIVPRRSVGAARPAAGACGDAAAGQPKLEGADDRRAASRRRRSPPTPASRTASSRRSPRSAARCAPPFRSSRATAGSACSCRRSRRWRTISSWSPPPRTRRRTIGLPVHIEGYAPPHDPRLNVIRVAPDPGVIEVNIHPAVELAGMRRDDHGDLRGGAADAARRRQVHDRRPPHRHRRRQPRRGRRRDAQRQPVPAPARSAEEPGAALAAPSVAVLSVLRPVHRPDQPGAALRRGAPRQPLRAGDRAWRRCRTRQGHARRCRGWSTGCSAICWSTSPATPTARKSASTSCSRRTARPAGSAWSSSAASRCRPMRA